MDQGFSEELKQRQRYWLEHLRAASVQEVTLAEYGRVAQVDCDAVSVAGAVQAQGRIDRRELRGCAGELCCRAGRQQ
jgi:hypothetical protein